MADFLFGVPRHVHLAHLKRERDSGDEWTDAAACVSLLLDLDRGEIQDLKHYGRQWKWNRISRGKRAGQRSDEAGRSRVRRAWPDLVAEILGWVTYYGTSWRSPLIRNVPDDWWEYVDYAPPGHDRDTTGDRPQNDRENGDSDTETDTNDRDTTGDRPQNDRLTKQNYKPSEDSLTPPRARGDEPAGFDPVAEFNETYAALPEAHPWQGFRLGIMQHPRVAGTVADADAWRETLRVWTESEYSPRDLDNVLDKYRAVVSAPGPHAGDDPGAGGEVRTPQRAGRPNGAAPGAHRRSDGGLGGVPGGVPEHRKSASDRRSEYGYDDARRDVRAALADLLPDAHRPGGGGSGDDGGGHDG